MAKATPIHGLNRDTRLRAALRRILRQRLADLLALRAPLLALLDEGVADDSVELLHDARVATRRLRAALSLARFTPGARRDDARQAVAALGRALGAVRDRDLLLAWLATAAPGSALGGTTAAQRQAQLAALRPVAQRFFAEQVAPLQEGLAQLSAPGRFTGPRVRRRLRRRLRRFCAALPAALSGRPDFVHELRIQAKKLRYHAELLALHDALPAAGEAVKALAPLQEALGTLHDVDVRLRWLLEQIAAAEAADLVLLAALVRSVLADREAQWQHLRAELDRWHSQRPLASLEAAL